MHAEHTQDYLTISYYSDWSSEYAARTVGDGGAPGKSGQISLGWKGSSESVNERILLLLKGSFVDFCCLTQGRFECRQAGFPPAGPDRLLRLPVHTSVGQGEPYSSVSMTAK